MVKELEGSLEKLDRLNESEPLLSFTQQCEITFKLAFGQRYHDFKRNIVDKKDVLLKHFTKVMREIEMDFPEIGNDNDASDDYDSVVDGLWTCLDCFRKNKEADKACVHCNSSNPKIGRWACETCTFFNVEGEKMCGACDTPRHLTKAIVKKKTKK